MAVNVERGNKEAMRAALAACITDKGLDPGPLFDAAGRLSLWFAAEKLAGSIEDLPPPPVAISAQDGMIPPRPSAAVHDQVSPPCLKTVRQEARILEPARAGDKQQALIASCVGALGF